ncbi:MAG: diphthine synthase [Candidatus Aenigmarchaeota archaeon]|nr:diphthine synthase [Candidatus Aenigmarchaeota archaeon]
MLYLISIGLHDEQDLSLRALAAAKKCAKLYADFYTTKTFASQASLEKIIGKPVIVAGRGNLEEGAKRLLAEAKNKDIGILVGGDALSATTHLMLLQEARKLGIEGRVIHGSGIYTAVAATGLPLYKFGPSVTIPFPQPGYKPTGFYDTMLENRKRGLHTLLLLDVRADEGRYLSPKQALQLLLDIEKQKGYKLLQPETEMVAACDLGGDELMAFGSIKGLLASKKIDRTPGVLILPGELHFTEKEFLENFKP